MTIFVAKTQSYEIYIRNISTTKNVQDKSH